jgi:hypothetical protein
MDIDALTVSLPPAKSITTTTEKIRLTYSWGACSLSKVEASCSNSNIGIYYHAYFDYAGKHENEKRECSAKIDMPAATQVCKQETGKDTPFWTDGTWAAYAY